MVFGGEGSDWLQRFVGLFEGKAAATFVVLAGLGLSLITKTAIESGDAAKLKIARNRIAKRALFLFVVGTSYILIWPADILHFYGIYMLFVLAFMSSKDKTLLLVAAFLIFVYPLLMMVWDYDTAWDFNTFEYEGFWTIKGFLRNLFYNGFHPVIPWAAFMLVGYWLGRQDLYKPQFLRRLFTISLLSFLGIQLLSYGLIRFLAEGEEAVVKELSQILGTSPMPPLPIYMLNGIAVSFTVISASILSTQYRTDNKFIKALSNTGRLALTFYVAHVVLGMGIVEAINPGKMGTYPIEFSVLYALGFSLLCVLFAVVWNTYYKSGPLEWVMRKVTN